MYRKLSLITLLALALFGCESNWAPSLSGKYPISTVSKALPMTDLDRLSLSKKTVVSNVSEAVAAISAATDDERIVFAPGVYKDLKMVVTASGLIDKPIIIESEVPGQAIISGDCSVELRGEHIVLKGFYFKNVNRTGTKWKVKGPGLIAIYGSYNRVTECVMDAINDVKSAYLTTSLTTAGDVPQYCRIDHCSFLNKTSRDQVINLNNTFKTTKTGPSGPAMYHRVDHCYFENPYKKKGNAGGGIRIGFWRKDFGRCLVDSNLFVRQNSEPEIITSKSKENVYYANTFEDCDGTMNLRHGDNQVLLQNFFTGSSTVEAGGAFIWGSGHLIAGNYFDLNKTLASRGNAALYLNSGAKASTHALAYSLTIANNFFVNNGGYAVDLQAFKSRRQPWCIKNSLKYRDPYNLSFSGNIFYHNSKTYSFFHTDTPSSSFGSFHGDLLYGTAALGVTPRTGMSVSKTETPTYDATRGIYVAPSGYTPAPLVYKSIKGIHLDLSVLASQGVVGKPLTKLETGATWF
ncbi:hypothetical protein K4L44_05085 [Halosquirtibacter laminarini]|uniref:Uncharacterized protein n=1 Tax=Halosquirtibacter laminarini TaxID=3374600 RepID=A0AC61NLX7_9BACT|nr:hypothetical protein K4L44_05085 [Prolixibacteraceae bacterium]